jgi:predicted amidohydrolase YtcJ
MIADTIASAMQADVLLRDTSKVTPDPAQPRARHLAIADGRILACSTASLDDLRAPARERGLRTEAGSDWLRIGPLKLFSDGALGSRTAFMLEPYEGRQDGYRGVPTLEPAELDELAEAMRLATDAELDLPVHTIGDAAVRRVLQLEPEALRETRVELTTVGGRITFEGA